MHILLLLRLDPRRLEEGLLHEVEFRVMAGCSHLTQLIKLSLLGLETEVLIKESTSACFQQEKIMPGKRSNTKGSSYLNDVY